MSSIVRASASTSCVPWAGIEEEKSPWPSRSAEVASAWSGAPMRRARTSETKSATSGEQERDECEPAHEARDRARDLLGGEPRLDEEDGFARRGEERQARGELVARGDRRDRDVAGRERFRVHVAVSRFDRFEPGRDGQEMDLDADLPRELLGEPVVEHADGQDAAARQSGYRDECPGRPALAARDHEAFALFGGGFEGLLPRNLDARRRDQLGVVEERAAVEPRGLAETAQHELQLQRVRFLHEARQRRAGGQQARRRHRVLADAPDFVARLVRRGAHARERLLLGLAAQQAERSERDRDDGEEDDARDREQQEPFEGTRPGDEALETRLPLLGEPQRSGFPLPQQRVQAQ